MKKLGIRIGDNFKVVGNKIATDLAKVLSKLPVSARIPARKGKETKVRYVRGPKT